MRFRSLAYHDVVTPEEIDGSGFPGSLAARYKLTPELFRAHLTSIKRRVGRPPVTVDRLENPALSPSPNWMLTFDDGGLSAHSRIAGVLEEFGWRAHFFVITDSIGEPGYLSRAQILELRARGHVIGSHTCSHPYPISGLAPSRQRTEWENSLAELSDILSEKVDAAAMPGGSYSRQAAAEARQAGIRYLFTLEPRSRPWDVSGCLCLGRYLIRRDTSAGRAAAYAAGAPGYCWPEWAWWNSKKLLKRLGGKRYEALKRRVLT